MDEHMNWEVLSSEYLFKDKWLKARKDKCKRPDGKIIDPYYVIEYMQWVSSVCLTEGNKVVMIKQYRHALGQVCIELPGGCVDKEDGTFETAARREALEETGYEFTGAVYLGATSPNPSTNTNLMHMFLLTGGKPKQEQELDHNEDIVVVEYSLPELAELLEQRNIVQSMHVTTIFYALQHLGYLKLNMPAGK